ncbi:GPW/gp25 family protein [Haliangium sp.]|uniref:GPW/gp25 family protein n=1 Tax=Haliangium sp. TaxID=2663208 RepID=UPI003D148771
MARDFLGTGWRFPLRPDASGTLGYVSGEANIEQSLRILLLTRLGERRMRPDLGTAAHELVFAPGSQQHLTAIEDSVRDAIRDFEPRVAVLAVQAELDPGDETRVLVAIDYRVRRSNNKRNLVFPFYLEEAL